MKIFKGWFFYLVVAVLLVLIASIYSRQHSLLNGHEDPTSKLLTHVPTIDTSKDIPGINTKALNDKKDDLLKTGQAATQKLASTTAEGMAPEGGFKGIIFRYLSQNTSTLAKGGFYFTENNDHSWDFGHQNGQKLWKMFSIKP